MTVQPQRLERKENQHKSSKATYSDCLESTIRLHGACQAQILANYDAEPMPGCGLSGPCFGGAPFQKATDFTWVAAFNLTSLQKVYLQLHSFAETDTDYYPVVGRPLLKLQPGQQDTEAMFKNGSFQNSGAPNMD